MYPSKDSQVGAQPGPGSFAAVAVHLSHAVAIVVPRPLLLPMLDAGVFQLQRLLHRPIAAPFIRVQRCCSGWEAALEHLPARRPVRVFPHKVADFPGAPADEGEDRRPVGGIGAVAPNLIGAAPRWIGGIGVQFPLFPPRSDTVRRPQKRDRSSAWWVRSHTSCSGPVGAACATAAVTNPVPGPAGRWAPLWRSPAGSTPALRVFAAFWQSGSLSG